MNRRRRWFNGSTCLLAAILAGGILTMGSPRVRADDDATAFSDMDQMVFDARQAFKQRQFDVAIKTCEKILRKDPDNLTALKIMGSGYFMLEDYARARHVWQTALKVAPDDPDIPKYMARLPESE